MSKKVDLGKAFKFEVALGKLTKVPKIPKDATVYPVQDKVIENLELVPKPRFQILLVGFLILTTALLLRIFYLQIVKGAENLARSSQNRLVFEKIPAPRGIIYDRKGQVLAENRPIFKLVKDNNTQVIDKEQALELESKNLAKEAPDLGPLGQIEIVPVRDYKLPGALSHLLGYTSEITADELAKLSGYSFGDKVGRLGIEAQAENYLRGFSGRQLIEVNAKGQTVSVLGTQAPAAGHNVTLTIDGNLQEKLFEELKAAIIKAGAKSGAAMASNPTTGEILALVSYPAFDSNLLSFGITQGELDKLNSDPAKPFLDRVTLGSYPPGSVFKLVTSAAGLEEKAISADTRIEDTGELFLGQFRFPNWNFICCGKKEGSLDIIHAIARSNDIFFYHVGELLGVDKLANWARKLGFGKTTGVELPEVAGLIPDPAWKLKTKGEPWFPGNTLHMAIGQGDVLTTPIQLNQLSSFFANGGKIYKPFLVSKISDEAGKPILTFKAKQLGDKLVSPKNLQLVREGMRQVAAAGGTAWPFADFKISCGAKTGTAEAGVEHPHAWFTVFCPYQAPEINLTVLIEEAGEGSSVSGPVARKVMDWYFSIKSGT